ncbi:MAG TPA: fibronectin type III domain-containing protein, partial [Bryobacteraceae bacterium]|nr:fibronectin type III domain-containing protein [Bryobacteraceae bacterium]
IRAIAVDAKGFVYTAAMGGAVSSRSPVPATPPGAAGGAAVTAAPTVITVTEAKTNEADTEQSGLKVSPDQGKGGASGQSSGTTAAPVVEVSGVEKSAIYRIAPDRTVETLRSSKSDNVYDLLLDGDGIVFSTDDRGRIYRWNASRLALLSEPGDGETTRLAQSGANLYGALSNPGRLIAFGATGAGLGRYESTVHDSVSVARWGHLQWHGSGSSIRFSTRTGNSVRPDATWSAWSEPVNGPNGALIASPAARFIQWRAEWSAGSSARLDTVDIPYLPQNAPPVVHSVSVTSIIGSNPTKSGPPAASASSAYSITVTDTGEAPAATTTSSASQSVSRLQSTQTQISWQADDPDSDKLVYSVYFRAEDGTAWQLIRSRMFENTLLLDPDVFADGRYFFKIAASDAPSNSTQFTRQSELISSPVLIDNTPPLVTLGAPRRDGTSLDIDVEGTDATSTLRLCEYSVDAGFWQPVESTDGVTDSPHERFHLHMDNLRPGEHLLVFRVYDAANNAGLARAILR